MNFKTTYILFGILAGLFVVLGLVLWLGPLPADTSPFVFPSLHSKEAPVSWLTFDYVEIDRGDAGKIELVRDPRTKQWTVNGYRADSGNVNAMIQSICESRRAPAEKPPSLKTWGLDPPEGGTVTLRSSEPQREIKLMLGAETPGDEATAVIYALSSDRGKEPMAVSKLDLAGVKSSWQSFRDRELLASRAPDIRSIKVSEGKNVLVSLARKEESNWRFSAPFQGDADSDPTGQDAPAPMGPIRSIGDLMTALADLKVEYKDDKDNDFVAGNVADFAKYNLDPAKADVLRIEVERETEIDKGDGTHETIKTPATLLIALKEKVGDKKDKYYARLERDKDVVRVSAASVDRILAFARQPDVLRDRHLIKLPGTFGPDAVYLEHGGERLEFRRPARGEWKLYRGKDSSRISDVVLNGLFQQLTRPYPSMTFPPDKDEAALGLKDPKTAQATVSIWVDGVDPKSKESPVLKDDVKDKPTVKLIFGNRVDSKDGERMVAVKRIDSADKATLLLVPEGILQDLKRGPLFYLRRELPPYNPNLPADASVTKVTLERGGTTHEMTRDKPGDPWKFVKPASLVQRHANGEAIVGFLHDLNHLTADELVAEKATEKELDQEYGLKSPTTRVSITLMRGTKPETYIYEFGKDKPRDDTRRFGRQVFPEGAGKRDMIFLVSKDKLASLNNQLQDLTLFKYNPGDARALFISSFWKQAKRLEFVLQSDNGASWKVKDDPEFKLDNSKAQRLITFLSTLKAERIEPDANTTKAEYGLADDDKTRLKLEVTLRDPAEKYEILIGAPDGKGGFYVTTNQSGKNAINVVGFSITIKQPDRDVFVVADSEKLLAGLKGESGWLNP